MSVRYSGVPEKVIIRAEFGFFAEEGIEGPL